MSENVYVVGIDMIRFGRFPEKSVPELGAEAAQLALKDAGVKIQDVEALYCGCVPLAPARYNYPALIPAQHQGACLFHRPEEFSAKLAALLASPLPESDSCRASAGRFAWPTVITAWDQALSALASREFATDFSPATAYP